MGGTAAQLVHAFKYGSWADLAEEMGERMAAERFSRAVMSEMGAVVPVPLSQARLRERGFNQADLLARRVASLRGLPLLEGVLLRTRHTDRQARLTPGGRATNVAQAFSVPRDQRSRVEDAHLLLIDDVLTTAATAQECVRTLCSAGARAVSVLAFARARPELPRD